MSRRLLHVTTIDMSIRFLLLGQLRSFTETGYEVAAMSAPGPWRTEIEAAGVRFIPWPSITRRWAPGTDLRALTELVRVLRDERFDIVHTHNPKSGLIGRLASRLARVPVIVNTVHGLYSTERDETPLRKLVLGAELVASRLSHFELYQSAEDLGRARRLRIVATRRSSYLGNGTDIDRFDPARVDTAATERLRSTWRIDPAAPVVGMVGRLVAEKGWSEFFEAARRVRARRPDVVFLAVGPHDPDKPDALSPQTIEAAERDVRFCGMVDRMPEALAVMDVFVLASHREGFPRSAIEAAAMGRALVLTDIRGCREVVTDGRNGLLVPPGDAAALAASIQRLLEDPATRTRFAEASRARAVQEFDERLVVERTLAVYDSLLGARTARTA